MRYTKQKLSLLCVLVLLLSMLTSCILKTSDITLPPSQETEVSTNKYFEPLLEQTDTGVLTSHFIDVGQGDCTFIELPNGKCMLIDAGDTGHGTDISWYIHSLGYNSIDYLVATHPHADHIGSMRAVLLSMKSSPKEFYIPRTDCDTKVYEKLLETIAASNTNVFEASAGTNIVNDRSLSVDVISPSKEYEDMNNSSAVVTVTYGNTRFLYMGDAESQAEEDITADVSAQVIKVGHHGSSSSSNNKFAQRVKPQFAVISVGKDNTYGHPHSGALRIWKKVGATVYRTDKDGTIILSSDGYSVKNKGSRVYSVGIEEYKYILNLNSNKIHKTSCSEVQNIDLKNAVYTKKSRSNLKKLGFATCGTCFK